MTHQTVDCIVRFHDVRRLDELTRCIFSLLGQQYRPVNVILALQRFSEQDVATTRASLAPFFALSGSPTLQICNLDQPTPKDARTLLLNMGLGAAQGRYVGFLDYDDVLYPEAYRLLVSQLQGTGAAIAFASVRVVLADVFPGFLHIEKEMPVPFGLGDNLRDLFDANFCPIHSFLIDRQQVDEVDLMFDSALNWEEDYDLLLRICAKYRSSFALIATRVGDYYFKKDASNSTPFNGLHTAGLRQAYDRVSTMIEARRRTTHVSPMVQAEFGLHPVSPDMTIRDFMSRVPGRAPA